ncbi:AlbA family DNA-binding domain-containing protein [Hymenobacter convexus]|uniref:AlbA family DNA-binding domain-containing protein n=1 Tax=Hymenobacter sp. CA1UV-4 TaxID=3063782 RepID=UPI002712BFC8|nr:ATP-binding protein [Hymenobacter sp. CA1UV-4]MDO7854435.1 ATP-binding protein [Hymenobacter sp. CA1UV-4]
MELLDLIQYENEKTGLDFKAIVYKADKFDDLLKDIMAMANAALEEDRYIVVGVKHYPNSERAFLGIEEFMDDATYYQLVHSNIEPDIQFEYFHVEVADKKVGVFRIYQCDNQPYLMKKDTKSLRRGDGFIRKGTSQMRLMRSDLDKIFAKRQVAPDLAAKLDAVFEVDGQPSTRLTPVLDSGLPSASAARSIRRAIADKELSAAEREAKKQEMLEKKLPGYMVFNIMESNPVFAQMAEMSAWASGRELPYEKRDLATLKEDLESVKKTYQAADLYYLYEERARKINLRISNHGEQYIENCSVEIRIKKSCPFVVADAVYPKPEHHSPFKALGLNGPSLEKINYPRVTETPESYVIKAHLGDLRHNFTTLALKEPARLTLPMNSSGQLEVTLTLFGKNLPKPYVKTLLVDIV